MSTTIYLVSIYAVDQQPASLEAKWDNYFTVVLQCKGFNHMSEGIVWGWGLFMYIEIKPAMYPWWLHSYRFCLHTTQQCSYLQDQTCYRGFQVACQNEKCQVQSPLTLTNHKLDISHLHLSCATWQIKLAEVKVSGLSLGTFHLDKQHWTPLYKQNAREDIQHPGCYGVKRLNVMLPKCKH